MQIRLEPWIRDKLYPLYREARRLIERADGIRHEAYYNDLPEVLNRAFAVCLGQGIRCALQITKRDDPRLGEGELGARRQVAVWRKPFGRGGEMPVCRVAMRASKPEDRNMQAYYRELRKVIDDPEEIAHGHLQETFCQQWGQRCQCAWCLSDSGCVVTLDRFDQAKPHMIKTLDAWIPYLQDGGHVEADGTFSARHDYDTYQRVHACLGAPLFPEVAGDGVDSEKVHGHTINKEKRHAVILDAAKGALANKGDALRMKPDYGAERGKPHAEKIAEELVNHPQDYFGADEPEMVAEGMVRYILRPAIKNGRLK